ncbi:MAG TPA: hypothetical protein VI485_28770 [Vicinamibacterales bacterium]|nr:hypothetical protein [Vicinamibacterales bacterium]
MDQRIARLPAEDRQAEVDRVNATIIRNIARVTLQRSQEAGVSIERYVATKVLTPAFLKDLEATMLLLSAVAELARDDVRTGRAR